MKSNTGQLTQLKHLSELQYRHEQSKMAALTHKEQDLRHHLAALKFQLDNKPFEGLESSALALANTRWLRWVDVRMTKLSTELAAILAEKEALRPRLARAFGRDQVARQLLISAKKSQSRKAKR